jgi:hypothetical protein
LKIICVYIVIGDAKPPEPVEIVIILPVSSPLYYCFKKI